MFSYAECFREVYFKRYYTVILLKLLGSLLSNTAEKKRNYIYKEIPKKLTEFSKSHSRKSATPNIKICLGNQFIHRHIQN